MGPTGNLKLFIRTVKRKKQQTNSHRPYFFAVVAIFNVRKRAKINFEPGHSCDATFSYKLICFHPSPSNSRKLISSQDTYVVSIRCMCQDVSKRGRIKRFNYDMAEMISIYDFFWVNSFRLHEPINYFGKRFADCSGGPNLSKFRSSSIKFNSMKSYSSLN